jgi:hypothetical protein
MTRSLKITESIQNTLSETREADIKITEKGSNRITIFGDEGNKTVNAPYLRWTGYEREDHMIALISNHLTDNNPTIIWACGPSLSGWSNLVPFTGYDWLVKYKGNDLTFDEVKSIYKKLSGAVNRKGGLGSDSKPEDWEKLDGNKYLPANDSDLSKMKKYLDEYN